jgi:hypothetical protein
MSESMETVTDDDPRTVADTIRPDDGYWLRQHRPTDDDPRTVADTLYAMISVEHVGHSEICRRLGIDPDMPYGQFRRRLEMGERAENLDPLTITEKSPRGPVTRPVAGALSRPRSAQSPRR